LNKFNETQLKNKSLERILNLIGIQINMSSRKISEKPVRAAATEKVAKSNPQKSKFHLEFPAKNGAAQKLAWMGYQNNDVLFMTGPAGTGKALPITSVLYKKNGPIFMKDVKIGDQIASDDGNFYNVTGVYPQGKKQKYKISFKDGKSIDCCEEHLWEISSNCNGWKNKIFNTKYLYENFLTPSGRTHLSIRCTDPVEFKEKEFNISPYVMGVLLAEGCFRSSRVSFTSMDEEIVQRVQKELNEEYIVKSSTKNPIDHSIKIKNKSNNVNSIKNTLVNFGLWDLKSVDKFIPNEYLYGSVQQRIDLLRGLMDGDGTVSKKSGMPIFYTSSLPLLTNFVELVNSLGGTCKVREKEASYKKDNVIVKCHKSYVCHVALKDINCFSLERKSNLCLERKKYFPKRIIKNVVKLDEYVDMQCISIDSPNNLYLTDDYIVTHNTYLAMAFAINDILLGVRKRIILTRPIVEAGESLGFLPGTFEEKVNPYMLPLLDSLYKLVGEDNPQRDLIDKSIEIAPIAFMRGRSQPLDVKILTPSGYVNMGCLSVGDFVMGANGLKTQINGIYPQGELDVYKVSFTDGTSVECSADHLWDTTTVYERKCKHNFSTKTTTEIMNSVKYGKKRYNHQVPICDAINFDSNCTNVPIDPYVLGALLGDGNLSTDASITLTSADNQIFDEVEKRLPQDLQLNEVKDEKQMS
jgi:phosphate starvation-inducible protein PhoH